MGYEANLCSPYYISRLSLKNVSRDFNETEAVTQQRERKEERGDLFAEMFAQREEKAAGGRGPDSATFPGPSSALILSLVALDHLSSPLKSTDVHMASSPQGWGMPVLSPLIVWRGGRTRQQGGGGWGGLAFIARKRAGCSPEPRWESGIINRSYRGLGKNAGLHGV